MTEQYSYRKTNDGKYFVLLNGESQNYCLKATTDAEAQKEIDWKNFARCENIKREEFAKESNHYEITYHFQNDTMTAIGIKSSSDGATMTTGLGTLPHAEATEVIIALQKANPKACYGEGSISELFKRFRQITNNMKAEGFNDIAVKAVLETVSEYTTTWPEDTWVPVNGFAMELNLHEQGASLWTMADHCYIDEYYIVRHSYFA